MKHRVKKSYLPFVIAGVVVVVVVTAVVGGWWVKIYKQSGFATASEKEATGPDVVITKDNGRVVYRFFYAKEVAKDTAMRKSMAESVVKAMELGRKRTADFLGMSYWKAKDDHIVLDIHINPFYPVLGDTTTFKKVGTTFKTTITISDPSPEIIGHEAVHIAMYYYSFPLRRPSLAVGEMLAMILGEGVEEQRGVVGLVPRTLRALQNSQFGYSTKDLLTIYYCPQNRQKAIQLYQSTAALGVFLLLNDGFNPLVEFIREGTKAGWLPDDTVRIFQQIFHRTLKENDRKMKEFYTELQRKFGNMSKEELRQYLKAQLELKFIKWEIEQIRKQSKTQK